MKGIIHVYTLHNDEEIFQIPVTVFNEAVTEQAFKESFAGYYVVLEMLDAN